jgi:hypothetical protein
MTSSRHAVEVCSVCGRCGSALKYRSPVPNLFEVNFIFSGSTAQRGLWAVAVQPSAGCGLLWLCSPARAMVFCGSVTQRGIWPPVALQPSAGYGLWLCNPARAVASCGSVAQRGLWPPVAL